MSSISEQLGVGGPREPESKTQLSRGGFQSICSSAFLIPEGQGKDSRMDWGHHLQGTGKAEEEPNWATVGTEGHQ